MIELRLYQKKVGAPVLQFRFIPIQFEYLLSGELVLSPQPPVSLIIENNWSDWEDVPVVKE